MTAPPKYPSDTGRRHLAWSARKRGTYTPAGLLPTVAWILSACASTAPSGGKGTALPWSSAGLKVGYVRSDAIIQSLADYADADNKLRAENARWMEQADQMSGQIAAKERELDELRLILSDQQRQVLEDELAALRRDLQKFRQETWYDEKSRYLRRRAELMEPINARVNDAIWKVAEEKGLDIVFDTVAGNIVYVKPAFDITEEVLEELRR